ncbi:uncharacterized protein CXorf38 homolog isoform 1-T2 [Discoglossus pictus]
MAQLGLLARLNSQGYKNWIKAGLCLQHLKSSLQEYIAAEMKAFHMKLAANIQAMPRGRCQCRPKGKQFQPNCPVCAEWKRQILEHHTNKNGEIHWGNCNPSLWPTDYWEVAKVYMPRGHSDKKAPKFCDAAALLNLINACDCFRGRDLNKVREVIKCRNDLMHSSDFEVSSNWLNEFGKKINNFIYEFTHIPGLREEGSRIQQMLRSDWTTEDLCPYEVDGHGPQDYREITISLIYETEKELIQQLLQERCLQIEEEGALTGEDLDSVKKVKNFLSDHKDLQDEMDRLEMLQNQMQL